MAERIRELENDFKEMLECIDFTKYDPCSKIFTRTLYIGLMYLSVMTLEKSSDVEEELSGAENYLSRYLETGDSTFKEMASDELRHAGILIKKHLAKTDSDKERSEFNSYEKRRQKILEKVSTATVKE